MKFDPFGYKRLTQRIEEIQHQHYNLMHIIKELARENGLTIEIYEPAKNSNAYVMWLKSNDPPRSIRMVPFPSGMRIFTKDGEVEVKP